MLMDVFARGGPVLAVLQLLLSAELYERFVSPARRSSVETWWWAVYVAAAPLLFSGSGLTANLAPVAGLFCTRFVVECFREGSADWLLTLLGRASRRDRVPTSPGLTPLLPD